MAKSFAEIRAEINTDIYENTSGMVTATNVNKDLQDIVDKVEEVQFSDVPAAAVGQVNPIKYNRTRNADGSAVWTVDTGGGSGTVTDVKIGSTSIVDSSGVATIPNATVTQPGLVTGNTLSNPARVVGIVDSNTLAVETASAAIKGVMQDVPAATGSYVRKRESSGASYWELATASTPDTAMSDTSTNAVQNRVIKQYVDAADANAVQNVKNPAGTIIPKVDGNVTLPAASGTDYGMVQLATSDMYHLSTDNRAVTPAYLNKAVEALDVAEVGGDGKFIQKISEVDGKIVATAADIDAAMSDTSANPVQNKVAKAYADSKIAEVQLNGTALTPTAGAVNIPASSWDKIGVLKVGGSAAVPANRTKYATTIYDNTLYVANASTTQVGVVTVGDNIVVTDASQGTISVPDASNTVKGVLLDVPAQDPSTATEDKKFVRVAKQDGSIAWEEGSGASGVTSIKVGPSGTAQTGDVTIPIATTTTNGVCKVGLLTSTSTDPVASSVLYTEFQKKADEVPAATTEDVEYVRKRKTDGTVEWTAVVKDIDVSSVFAATPALPSGYTLATLQGKNLFGIADGNRFPVTLKYDSTKPAGSQGLFYYVDFDGTDTQIVKSIL